jgi:hypothetical protein
MWFAYEARRHEGRLARAIEAVAPRCDWGKHDIRRVRLVGRRSLAVIVERPITLGDGGVDALQRVLLRRWFAVIGPPRPAATN